MAPNPQFLKPRNLLLFAGVVALIAGLVLRQAALLQLAAVCISTLALAWWQARGMLGDVTVKRQHHERAFQGNNVAVTVTLQSQGGKSVELVRVEDRFPPATAGRVRRLLDRPLEPRLATEISYFGTCDHRRGLYVLGPISLQATDPLGFFADDYTIEEFTRLVVYPLAVDLQHADLLGEGVLEHVGLDVKPRAGVSEEFLGVREYRHGDPQRLVHWRSSARHGRLMVKEFEEEVTTLVTFFLDLGRLGLSGVGDQTSVEYGIRACASFAKRAVERGHQVQFFGIGQKIEHVPPGSGTAHLLNLLDRLAFLRAEGDSAFAWSARNYVTMLAPGSTAVLLLGATTIDLETMAPLVALLADRKVLPIFAIIDDRAFIKVYREQEERHHQALPLEDVVRELKLLGARVHVIRRAKSVEQALVQGLERETT